ncbi:MAG: hypothetical protein K2H72_04220 [Muribaculaceae bacterium]|nr:hypothetical protein [Muribaculaceae bacterium]
METSQPFTISRATIFKTVILSPSTGWILWIVFAIGAILTALGCFLDVRYLLLGLIMILTVLPSMAFFLFVNYMFASEMVANLLNHTIERRPNGYLLRIFRPADQNDPKEKDKEWIESGRLTFFDYNIVKIKTTTQYEVIFLKDSPLTILFVPRY